MDLTTCILSLLIATCIFSLISCGQLPPTPQPVTPPSEQHLITTPSDLLNDEGILIQRGWSPHPLLNYNPENIKLGTGQKREWEFFTVLSSAYVLNLTIADIGYARFCTVDSIDFASGETRAGGVVSLLGDLKLSMTRSSTGGVSCVYRGKEVMRYERTADKRIAVFDIPKTLFTDRMRGRIEMLQDPKMDFLALATPFPEDPREFFYEHKIVNMPASGEVEAGDRKISFPAGEAWAVMDWGRGAWPRKLMWRWGAASGKVNGASVGFNIGNGFGDMSAASENLVVYDNAGHKLDRVTWDYDTKEYMKPWHFRGNDGRFEMTLEPIYDQHVGANALVKSARLHKLYGYYSGSVVLDDGRRVEVDKILGFAEEVFLKW
ncbi:MAG: DUF2804 domain-containing protein [bacterium]|nr:DUF2804 domain-containing protein [bacterium]